MQLFAWLRMRIDWPENHPKQSIKYRRNAREFVIITINKVKKRDLCSIYVRAHIATTYNNIAIISTIIIIIGIVRFLCMREACSNQRTQIHTHRVCCYISYECNIKCHTDNIAESSSSSSDNNSHSDDLRICRVFLHAHVQNL